MEEKLLAGKFMRIHRSYIVGLDHVAAVGRGTRQVRGKTLPVSDDYREAVDAFLPAGSRTRPGNLAINYVFITSVSH
jgi:DNA-binding LytR/AlgR family response regulator